MSKGPGEPEWPNEKLDEEKKQRREEQSEIGDNIRCKSDPDYVKYFLAEKDGHDSGLRLPEC